MGYYENCVFDADLWPFSGVFVKNWSEIGRKLWKCVVIFVYIKEETRFWCEIRCCLVVFIERCSWFSDVCGMMLLTRIDWWRICVDFFEVDVEIVWVGWIFDAEVNGILRYRRDEDEHIGFPYYTYICQVLTTPPLHYHF